jgi:hypothetical protein
MGTTVVLARACDAEALLGRTRLFGARPLCGGNLRGTAGHDGRQQNCDRGEYSLEIVHMPTRVIEKPVSVDVLIDH